MLKKGDRAGQPKEKRENKWINRAKTQGGVGQPKEKRKKMNGSVGAKNRGRAGQPKEKR